MACKKSLFRPLCSRTLIPADNISMKILKRNLLFILILLFIIISGCLTKPSVIEHGIFAPSRHEYVLGQDGVCSIQFDDTLTLWTFADTILGKWKTGNGPVSSLETDTISDAMISNSLAWSERITSKNFRNIKLSYLTEDGRPTQFIKNRSGEDPLYHRFWALDGVRVGNRVYVYYLHVYVPDYTKLLDFKVLYSGLAVWYIPEGWRPGDPVRFKRLGQMFQGEYPAYGASVMLKDGYVYLAGHFKKGDRFPLSFARVQDYKIEDITAYEFLTAGGVWVKDIDAAGEFFGDVSGECSISYNSRLNKYILIYSKIFTGEITAVSFAGFDSMSEAEHATVYVPKKKEGAPMWPYSGKEIFSEDGRIFIIYIDPMIYQPMLIELKF